MLKYRSQIVDKRIMNALTTIQQFQSDYIGLKSVLQQIILQVSSKSCTTSENYDTVISILVNQLSKFFKRTVTAEKFLQGSFDYDEFSCQHCCEILCKPVTLPCGHTFCQNCLLEKSTTRCLVCGSSINQSDVSLYRQNVTLSAILEKWHSVKSAGRLLTVRGLHLMSKKKYEEAIPVLTEALDFIPNSHITLTHRSEAYIMTGRLDKALKDAVKSINSYRKWAKTYLLKATVLYQQGRTEEAFFPYLMCIFLDSNNTTAKLRLKKIIAKLTASSTRASSPSSPDRKRHKRRASPDFLSPVVLKQFCCESTDGGYLLRQTWSNLEEWEKDRIGDVDTNVSRNSSSDLLPEDEPSSSKALQDKDELHRKDLLPDTERAIDRLLLINITLNQDYATSSKEPYQSSTCDIDTSLIEASDFECSLCMRLLHNPVCTPCGHVYCQFCIERCLDHSPRCPLCKTSMEEYLAESLEKTHPTCDYVTNSIIKRFLPEQRKEREKQHEEEINELNQTQPIFVCTIAFPSVVCPLHIFEPRYRLMLRRCLEFNKQEFGMCMPHPSEPHSEIGTLLKVRSVTYFPDGRSVVDSIGLRRFKATNREVKDGYNVAKLNYIVDKQIRDLQATQDLCNKVYHEAQTWFSNLPNKVKERVKQHFGDFPEMDSNLESENGPSWLWWVLAVLPLEDRIKVVLLEKDSVHDRLLIIHRTFTCLKRRNAR